MHIALKRENMKNYGCAVCGNEALVENLDALPLSWGYIKLLPPVGRIQ